jgi:predicted aminopeptidase
VTRSFFRMVILACLALTLTSCSGAGYVAQSLKGHAGIMAARQSVSRLISDPSTPADLRARMEAASAMRQFASDELDLPDNASYRSYVDIGRDYVTIAVYAAPEFSLTPTIWCFPVFGCVPYRGYFSRDAVAKTVRELQEQGLDVHVTGITAYSTLGWSADPLLSTMFTRDRTYLASLVFHELAHQRVYVNNDTAFNEAFAVAVEMTGVRKWLKVQGDAAALARYEAGLKRNAEFLELVAKTKRELAQIYATPATAERKRAEKAAAIERLRTRYRRMRDESWGGFAGYDNWVEGPVNNAKLAATSVYNDLVPAFLRLFDLCSRDYARFYAAVARLGRLAKDGRAEALASARSCG